jgi:N-acetylmuramoyl-L-alanine amidase
MHEQVRLIRILLAFTAFLLITSSAPVCISQEEPPLVEVRYLGSHSYAGFTRLVFDTGGVSPDGFKVNFVPERRQVVIYPQSGLLAYSFAPVDAVDDVVTGIDLVEDDSGKRGIVASLGQGVGGVRLSYLTEPYRLALDISKKAGVEGYLVYGRQVKTVAIDPGHGGRNSGSGARGGRAEKDIALDTAIRLKNNLTRMGYKAVLTRSNDADVSMDARVGMANGQKADLFISIHASGGNFPKGGGPAIYVLDPEDFMAGPKKGPLSWDEQNAPYLPESLRLSGKLWGALRKTEAGRPVVHSVRLAGFSGLAMPAVMVELGNLDNQAKAGLLSEDSFRGKVADSLARGIADFSKGDHD